MSNVTITIFVRSNQVISLIALLSKIKLQASKGLPKSRLDPEKYKSSIIYRTFRFDDSVQVNVSPDQFFELERLIYPEQ